MKNRKLPDKSDRSSRCLMKHLLVIFLLKSVLGQFFECPSSELFLISHYLGSRNCSDNPDSGSTCGEKIPPNTECYILIYPKSTDLYIAQVQITARKMSNGDGIIIDGVFDTVVSDNNGANFDLRAAFPFSQDLEKPILNITIYTGENSTMTFGYYIQRNNEPIFNASQGDIYLSEGGLAQFVQLKGTIYGDYWLITSDDQIGISSGTSPASNEYDLLNIWIYLNNTIIGSAYSAGSGIFEPEYGDITLVCVLDNIDVIDGTVILNPKSNYNFCHQFAPVIWTRSPNAIEIQLRGDGGTYCFTWLNSAYTPLRTYIDAIYLSNSSFTMEVSIIAGAPVPDPIASKTLLAFYNSTFNLPQKLPGFATTFMITTYSKEVRLMFDNYDQRTQEHTAVKGKTGFLATKGYPYNMTEQTADVLIMNEYPFNFSLTVQNSYSPDATIMVHGNGTILAQNLSAQTNSTYSFWDAVIGLRIDGGSGINGGVYLTYQILDVMDPPTTTTTTTITTTTIPATTDISSVTEENTTVMDTTIEATTPKAARFFNGLFFRIFLILLVLEYNIY